MPRTLPWLKDAAPSKLPSASRSPASHSVKRQRVEAPSTSTLKSHHSSKPASSTSTSTSSNNNDDDELRGPSSSPPANATAATTHPPPSPPSPFRDGADDVWIMVEDEFTATAQLFTSHLHRAEYRRLKLKAAEQRSFNSLLNNRGATDHLTSRSIPSKVRDAQATRNRRAKGALREIGGVSDSEPEDWEGVGDADVAIPDRNLARLMVRPAGEKVRSRTRLQGLVGSPVKSNTRAAAGFGKQDTKVGMGGRVKKGVGGLPRLDLKMEKPVGFDVDETLDVSLQKKEEGLSMKGEGTSYKTKLQSAPDDFPFARSSLVQRKPKAVKREKKDGDEDDESAQVPTFLY